MDRVNHNKALFSDIEQKVVIRSNQKYIDMMKSTNDVKEWNEMRKKVSAEFQGDQEELLMLFGYIDGVLFVDKFKSS